MSNNNLPNLFKDSTQFLDSEQILIQSQCLEKNIKWLCHFTPRSNLELIKQHGLVPRNNIQGSFIVTDEYRYDGNSDTTCLSISKPNKWMFEKKQQEGFDLCLLLINPEVLYLKRCAFYPYNAATASYRGIPIEELMGVDAMKAIFSDSITFQKSRHASQSYQRNSHLNIAEPTSDQAEVQCYESIEPEYIQYIIENNIPLIYQEICRFVESHKDSLSESILTKHSLLENEKRENETLTAINDDIRLPLAIDTIEEQQLKQDQHIHLISKSETIPTEIIDKSSDVNEESIDLENKKTRSYSNETTAFLNRLHQLNMDFLTDYFKSDETDPRLPLERISLNNVYTELLASNTLTVSEKSKIIDEMTKFNRYFDTGEDITSEDSESKQQKLQENSSSRNKSATNYSSSADGCGSLIFIIIVVLVIMFIF